MSVGERHSIRARTTDGVGEPGPSFDVNSTNEEVVTVKREDGEEFEIPKRLLNEHLERGFTYNGKGKIDPETLPDDPEEEITLADGSVIKRAAQRGSVRKAVVGDPDAGPVSNALEADTETVKREAEVRKSEEQKRSTDTETTEARRKKRAE